MSKRQRRGEGWTFLGVTTLGAGAALAATGGSIAVATGLREAGQYSAAEYVDIAVTYSAIASAILVPIAIFALGVRMRS